MNYDIYNVGIDVVQYSNANDYEAANNIATAFGYRLMNVNSVSEIVNQLAPNYWRHLIIVGGQNANPVFAEAVNSSGGIIRSIGAQDQNFIMIQYVINTKDLFGNVTSDIWAVASYDIPETLASAAYMIGGGLYKGIPYIKNVRKPVGSTPPTPPDGGGTTSGLTMSMIIDSLKVGAPYYAIGAAVGIGSALLEPGKINKILKIGMVLGIGVGAYFTLNDLHKKGIF